MKIITAIILSLSISSLALAGNESNRFQDGQIAFSNNNYELAHEIWLKLANNNNTLAQSTLGYLYAEGLGVKQNYNVSAMWIKKAADNGEIQAMYNLAGLYTQGLGVDKNFEKAEALYRKSLSLGFKVSVSGLINLYRSGEIRPLNDNEREFWEQEEIKLQNESYARELYVKSGIAARP